MLCVLCLVFSGYLHTLMIVYNCLAKEKHYSVYITMRKALMYFCVLVYLVLSILFIFYDLQLFVQWAMGSRTNAKKCFAQSVLM